MSTFTIKDKNYIPADDLSWSDVHGELVIIDAKTGDYHVMNEVGRVIWLAIVENCTTDQVINKIQSEFSVNKEDAEKDMIFFVNDLFKRNLLKAECKP